MGLEQNVLSEKGLKVSIGKNRYFIHRHSFASGLVFLAKNPSEICDRLRLELHKKCRNKNDKLDKKNVASIDTLLENKCFTPTHLLRYFCNLTSK